MLHAKTGSLLWALGLLLTVPVALGDIDLEWRPLTQTVAVGDPVGIGIYAVSDNGDNQNWSSVQTIITWDPTYLLLTGSTDTLWTSSFLEGDSFGLNESSPPADGDGLWAGYVFPGNSLPATPAGNLVTTITFQALTETPSTLVEILPSIQLPSYPTCYTKVISGTQNVVGEIGVPASVTIIPEPTGLVLLALGALLVIGRR